MGLTSCPLRTLVFENRFHIMIFESQTLLLFEMNFIFCYSEVLYEDTTFKHRELSALVASKVKFIIPADNWRFKSNSEKKKKEFLVTFRQLVKFCLTLSKTSPGFYVSAVQVF